MSASSCKAANVWRGGARWRKARAESELFLASPRVKAARCSRSERADPFGSPEGSTRASRNSTYPTGRFIYFFSLQTTFFIYLFIYLYIVKIIRASRNICIREQPKEIFSSSFAHPRSPSLFVLFRDATEIFVLFERWHPRQRNPRERKEEKYHRAHIEYEGISGGVDGPTSLLFPG